MDYGVSLYSKCGICNQEVVPLEIDSQPPVRNEEIVKVTFYFQSLVGIGDRKVKSEISN
jgi:hypothetical protein